MPSMVWSISVEPTTSRGRAPTSTQVSAEEVAGWATSRPLGYKRRKSMTLVLQVAKFDPLRHAPDETARPDLE